MRRFYAFHENFDAGRVMLGENETRHLRDVLRLQAGAEVRVFDGLGAEFSCRVEDIGKKSAALSVIEKVSPAAPESGLDLTLATAVLKGEKFDLVVQKAVELGVTTLIPLETARCDVKVRDAEKKLARWRKIALEATKQSGRARIMEITGMRGFNAFISDAENAVFFSERGGDSFSVVKPAKKITALIGPEGGWDDSEIEAARHSGAAIVTLGGRTLRAETAAVSIAAILQHRFGDLS